MKSAKEHKIQGAVMVVGGGIAGMQSALDLANSGYYVHLVEKSPAIGGVMAQLDKTFPTNDCAMWVISPKLVEVGRHINIELHTCSSVEKIEGESGNYQITLRKTPRYIDPDKCTACGDCSEVCPVERPSEYEMNLVNRKATYKPYAQAIPSGFAVEKLSPAPCRIGCPAGINVQGYVAMVKQGKYREAVEIIMQKLPFPGVLGRVCPHPCERSCRRLEKDEALCIRELKRIAADHVDLNDIPVPEITLKNKKVAVVGAGPAGLSAAYFLALDGYSVTVYEAMPEAGGMMRYGIPEHRLPRSVLDAEINNLKRYGVDILTGTAIGKDVTLKDLEDQGVEAVFIAVGAWKSVKSGIPEQISEQIPGQDLDGVTDATTFLREVHSGNTSKLNGKVIIAGGGPAALDSGRVALRLGADEVHIVYPRSQSEMPVEKEALAEAVEEGINIHYQTMPVAIQGKDGKVSGMACARTRLSETDTTGRRKPVPAEGSGLVMDADHIITDSGREPDLGFLENEKDIKISGWNLLTVNPETLQTGQGKIFAGGDAVTGPASVIEAVEAGKRAAEYMARYLEGRDLPSGWQDEPPMETHWAPIPEHIPVKKRMQVPVLDVDKRLAGFDEVVLPVDEKTAQEEAARCVDCGGCCECLECVSVCKAEAITVETHHETPETLSVDVGAVILTPGLKPYDPSGQDNFQYKKYPNVITSIEFERILSAGGPTAGHILRPSDNTEPKKIAWLQCVGSRGQNKTKNEYCSGVCCMYAVKEAVIAKEHMGDELETTIFFMDMRTHGKDFEKYYERAKSRGVRFIRSRVHTINQAEDAPGSLKLRYVTEAGDLMKEAFDMVVLSVGMEPSVSAVDLAGTMGISLNKFNFVETRDIAPVDTTQPGIFVAGVAQGCKDIPQSVMEASAAACQAGITMAPARGTRVREISFPPETDVTGQEPRIGVFVCNCGVNIGGIADVPSIVEYSKTLPGVVHVEENLFSCSQDTQEKMVEVIKAHNLNRIVVAACTPRTHEPLFQETIRNAGLNPYLFEMANIRNQCTWVHSNDREAATQKSRDLVKMAVARSMLLESIPDLSVEVNRSALVVGGGVAGMTAAISLANQGFPATIVEQSSELGGSAKDLKTTWRGEDVTVFLAGLKENVQNHPDITVLLNSKVTDTTGFVGNFETTVMSGDVSRTVTHGVGIIATGGRAVETDEYLYGKHPNVTKWHDLEHHPEKLKNADSVVFIQCVGSRTDDRPYCSRICCTAAISQAVDIKENSPDMDVYVLYRDIRTYAEREILYNQARKLGVIFIRYTPDRKPVVTEAGDKLAVRVFEPVIQMDLEIEADVVNLATAIEPADNHELAAHYKVPLNEDRFYMEAHAKLRPVDFATDGLFVCGLAHYPKSLDESIAQAMAAAGRAATVLSKSAITVSPLVSDVDAEKCIGCGLCAEVCPFNAIILEEVEGKGKQAKNISASCKGCGLCAASCPQKAISMLHFKDEQIVAAICAAA